MPHPSKHHLSPRKSYDVCRPYDELPPSHIKGQFVNPKNPTMSSTWPTPPKDIYARPSFDPHTLKKAYKYEKGLKPLKRAKIALIWAKTSKKGLNPLKGD